MKNNISKVLTNSLLFLILGVFVGIPIASLGITKLAETGKPQVLSAQDIQVEEEKIKEYEDIILSLKEQLSQCKESTETLELVKIVDSENTSKTNVTNQAQE